MAIKLLVGTVLGFLTGLGIGGGSLLILWLTVVMEMPQAEARGINLLFFLPAAAIACCFRWKQGTLKVRKILPAIVSGAATAAVFSAVSLRINADVLKKAFGILLLFTGVRELLYKPQESSQRLRKAK